MWYLWILTKAIMMLCLSLPATKAYVELIGVEKHERAYLQCMYCKVKPQIQRELSRTIKSRCACVWMYMVTNLILLCSLKTYLSFETWKQLCKKTWAILFISSFFRRASEYPLFYISQTLVHFFSTLFSLFFLLLFMNNFCIASCFF